MQQRNPSNKKIIDVSHHQGVIDWSKVALDCDGAYVKATEGVGYRDPQFASNATTVAKVGLKVGYYHYARPETGNTAKKEADAFLVAVLGLHADLPHVLDVEGSASQIGTARLTDWVLEWLQIVAAHSGCRVMIYTGASFAKTYLGSKLAGYPLWVAHYGDVDKPMSGPTWDRWAMWQYSSEGVVPGITGRVDVNEMDLSFWEEVTDMGIKPMVSTDANKIIAFMSAAYGASGDKEAQAEFHRLANELRRVSEQPQN